MNNLMQSFSFVLPTKIVYGPGCIQELNAELQAVGAKRLLVVTDEGITKAGILVRVENLLAASGLPYIIFDGVEPNPKDVNAEAGARLARDFNADALLAVGGGSPIDCAKAIGVLLGHQAEKIKPYEGKTSATLPSPPLVTIPTTAGTGSELTFSAVITDTENHYKMTVKSPYTAAKTAICDPELTLSVPANVTAATGMDALTHAIEAYTANCAEPISDAVALYAIELIYPNLRKAVENGNDLAARSAMLMGSMLAGIAFSHSDVASVHCLAESLGGLRDLHHGVCNAVLLPHVMRYSVDFCRERYARIARAMGLSFADEDAGAEAAVRAVEQLAMDVRLPAFRTLGVPEADLETIAEMSAKNISTASNPRPMEKADYLRVLEMAMADQ